MYNLFFSLQAIENICDLSWLWVLLGLLIPFILGYLIGMSVWKKYRAIAEEWEAKANALTKQKAKLEEELAACRKKRAELDSELSRARGEVRELKIKLDNEAKQNMKLAEQLKNVPTGTSKAPSMASGIAASSMAAAAGSISDESLAAAKAVFGKKIKADDLKIIEGIGPKIEGLFKDAGIKTWYLLSQADASDLKKILDDAGPRYQMHNPSTWPRQAAMAYHGEWAELLKYQDELDGGKE